MANKLLVSTKELIRKRIEEVQRRRLPLRRCGKSKTGINYLLAKWDKHNVKTT